jgi:hypothetical protein
MNSKWLLLGASLLLAGNLAGRAGTTNDVSNNLGKAFFGADAISATEWDAQAFASGTVTNLTSVTLNLFQKDGAAGTCWVKLYAQSGAQGTPGTNVVATLATGLSISGLSTNTDNTITIALSPSVPLNPGAGYYIVVGADAGATGLQWGYTNDPLGAPGFPSSFSCTSDSGATWRAPRISLPQRMQVTGSF